jgi:hypothetical protein
MANDFIAVEVRGIPELMAKLDKLPEAAADDGVDAANKYLVNIFKHYPSYRYVSRKRAYGQTFVSDKQRRYVMAMIREGVITPGVSNRTPTMADGWKVYGKGKDSFVANETPYAAFLMGDANQQANQPLLAGWRSAALLVRANNETVLKKFDAGVKKAIKRIGLD